MISTVDADVLAMDLRYALETMEERSHLGLQNSEAEDLRRRILARIRALEKSSTVSFETVSMAEIPE